MKISTADIASIVNGKLTGRPDLFAKELLTDSRHFNFTSESAFFAVRGKNHDGHRFIDQLYRKGIRIFIIEELPSDLAAFTDSAFIKVLNTITALQDLAAFKRKQFKGLVIGITGSAGKTT